MSIDKFATDSAFEQNVAMEMQRNFERYQFLKWGQGAFDDFRVVPPGTGICHQVNLEYLAQVVWQQTTEGPIACPDTLVGTDSHTTMINGLGVLGWGVGGIEAEAAMLGQPISMLIPDVVGFELTGQMREGITATDLVLQVVQMLRSHGVVGKFVEFFGSGLDQLPLADRATIANMAPEYGATCGFFPVDAQTLTYLKLTGRDPHTIARVEAYCRAQGMWRDEHYTQPEFAATLQLDMSTVEPNLAGPKRPQDRVAVRELRAATDQFIELDGKSDQLDTAFPLEHSEEPMHHGDVVIAAITSCTNTSNPAVMVGAGLVAQKALARGLQRKPWVKSSLAPGSKVVTDYLTKAGLQESLDDLGFNLVGYGCTTCIGNSGPLPAAVAETIASNDLVACGVLSGNRNFEGRIHPLVKANWLASPPLVVAYALAGTTRIDLSQDPLGTDKNGEPVYLRDIWPSNAEIAEVVQSVNSDMFRKEYGAVFDGDDSWRDIKVSGGATYAFSEDSTYIQLPPFFEEQYQGNRQNILAAPMLAMLGDSVTTDHISPAGAIPLDSPAAQYLRDHGVAESDFNSYGSRRGNHQVMMRGTFGNIRIRNEMTPELEGGYTRLHGQSQPSSFTMPPWIMCPGALAPLWLVAGNTARVPAVTGRPKALYCWVSKPSLLKASSASTAPTWLGWVYCPCNLCRVTRARHWSYRAMKPLIFWAWMGTWSPNNYCPPWFTTRTGNNAKYNCNPGWIPWLRLNTTGLEACSPTSSTASPKRPDSGIASWLSFAPRKTAWVR